VVVISKEKRLFSRALVEGLQTMFVDRPWMEALRGKEITAQWLSQQLKPYGLSREGCGSEKSGQKGYEAEELMDVFKRYVPRAELEAFRAESFEEAVRA